MTTAVADAAVAGAASKATWTGSAVTVLSTFTSSDFGLWAGVAIGVAGLVVNWYFKRKSDLREAATELRAQEAHAAFMANLKDEAGDSLAEPKPAA